MDERVCLIACGKWFVVFVGTNRKLVAESKACFLWIGTIGHKKSPFLSKEAIVSGSSSRT